MELQFFVMMTAELENRKEILQLQPVEDFAADAASCRGILEDKKRS